MSRKQFADLDFASGARILNLPTPASNGEPARLLDLNTAIEGLKNKDPAKVSTQGNINLSAPGASIDGQSMSAGDRFLARFQTSQPENGGYIWNGAATPATRSLDMNSAAEL